jgi:hypothetical protein
LGGLTVHGVRAARPVVLAALLLATGCSTTIATNPDAYPFPSHEVFALRSGVSLSNGYPTEKRVELASHVFCDLRHFTETALTRVQRESRRRAPHCNRRRQANHPAHDAPELIRGDDEGRVTPRRSSNGERLEPTASRKLAATRCAPSTARSRAVTAF